MQDVGSQDPALVVRNYRHIRSILMMYLLFTTAALPLAFWLCLKLFTGVDNRFASWPTASGIAVILLCWFGTVATLLGSRGWRFTIYFLAILFPAVALLSAFGNWIFAAATFPIAAVLAFITFKGLSQYSQTVGRLQPAHQDVANTWLRSVFQVAAGVTSGCAIGFGLSQLISQEVAVTIVAPSPVVAMNLMVLGLQWGWIQVVSESGRARDAALDRVNVTRNPWDREGDNAAWLVALMLVPGIVAVVIAYWHASEVSRSMSAASITVVCSAVAGLSGAIASIGVPWAIRRSRHLPALVD